MAPSRQLRRVWLLLTGKTPEPSDYEELLQASDAAQVQAILERHIDAIMDSDAFYQRLVDFGHDWINVGRYTTGAAGEAYWGHMSGVLTMMGSMSSFSRERVRAARFIEIFTCRDFNPPPADVHFAPYDRDPATTGTCQHCHQLMDPASIAFKRWDFEGDYIWQLPVLGGVHTAQIKPNTNKKASPFRRWFDAWSPDTVLTPFSQAELDENPRRLLMDTIPSDVPLFGVNNDGTSGPLGFGKMVVKSGEFDRCAVRQLHRFAVGRDIDPAKERGYLDKLVETFVAQDRQAKPFIKQLMLGDTFKRGLKDANTLPCQPPLGLEPERMRPRRRARASASATTAAARSRALHQGRTRHHPRQAGAKRRGVSWPWLKRPLLRLGRGLRVALGARPSLCCPRRS